MNKITYIFIALSALSLSAKGTISGVIQPMFSFEENESFSEEGKSSFSLHRARIKMKHKKDVSSVDFLGAVSFDLAEKSHSDFLKNAYVGMNIRPWLSWRMGQFKSKFGYESSEPSKELAFIFRGELSNYLRKKTESSGYQIGGELYGTLAGKFHYSAALFNNEGFDVKGGNSEVYLKRIFALPVFSLSFEPRENVEITASAAFPFHGTVNMLNEPLGKRYFFSNLAVNFQIRKYQGAFELFIGEDTADTKEYLFYTSTATDGISQALSYSNSFTFPIQDKLTALITGRFEYLNGMGFDEIEYLDRSFYYTLTAGTRIAYGNQYYADINVDNSFDSNFQSINALRLTFQCTAQISLSKEK